MNHSHSDARTFGKRGAVAALAVPLAAEEQDTTFIEDLKLFATGWLGGLVFFGTFLA
ncbi:MAG: hypothetical protein M3Q08_09360 [Pseudomonadota bacterium]|nr:hypothetical protein [Pseudomonadota bacterium]